MKGRGLKRILPVTTGVTSGAVPSMYVWYHKELEPIFLFSSQTFGKTRSVRWIRVKLQEAHVARLKHLRGFLRFCWWTSKSLRHYLQQSPSHSCFRNRESGKHGKQKEEAQKREMEATRCRLPTQSSRTPSCARSAFMFNHRVIVHCLVDLHLRARWVITRAERLSELSIEPNRKTEHRGKANSSRLSD